MINFAEIPRVRRSMAGRRLLVVAAFALVVCNAFAWPPQQFANGTFAQGTMWIGASTNATGGGGGGGTPPGDGYEANLFAYYTLDDSDGNSIDSVSAHNFAFDPPPSSPVTMAGKIGSAYDLLDWDSKRASDTVFNFTGHDFAIRCWVYLTGTQADNGWFFARGWWGLKRDSADKITFEVQGSSTTADLSSADLTTGTWHHIFVYHKNGVEIGMQVDNGARTTLAHTDGLTLSASVDMFIEGAFDGSHFGLDEIAVWFDYIPTTDDITFDWNSGAGRSYPLP